jgi:hypothetical protein
MNCDGFERKLSWPTLRSTVLVFAWSDCEISVKTVGLQAKISFWYLLDMKQGC